MRNGLSIAVLLGVLLSTIGTHEAPARAQPVVTQTSDPMETIIEMHRRLTSLSPDEKRCGLPPEPLSYNDRHPSGVDAAVIDCLARARSPRTAWRAFLMAYHAFESGRSACEVARLMKISRAAEDYSIISSYLIKPPADDRDLLLFSARYPYITLSEAKHAYLNGVSPAAASDLARHISQADACEEELRPYGSEGLATFVRN